jgi:hypothetical protein
MMPRRSSIERQIVTGRLRRRPPFRSPQAQAGFLTSLDRFAGYLGTLSGSR